MGKDDGSVWATGLNNDGQLGDGTSFQKWKPVRMKAAASFIKIGAGVFHNVMLSNTSEVYACGRNTHGQFGDGTRLSSNVPRATGFTGVISVEASEYYSLFTRNDGT